MSHRTPSVAPAAATATADLPLLRARLAWYELHQVAAACMPLLDHPWERGLDPRDRLAATVRQVARGRWPVTPLPEAADVLWTRLQAVLDPSPAAQWVDRDRCDASNRRPELAPLLLGLAAAAHAALVARTRDLARAARAYPPPPPARVVAAAHRRARWSDAHEARLPAPVRTFYRAIRDVIDLQAAVEDLLMTGRAVGPPRGWVTLLLHCTGSVRLGALDLLAARAAAHVPNAVAALTLLAAEAPAAWWASFTEAELLAMLQSPYAPLREHAGREGIAARVRPVPAGRRRPVR